MSGMDWELLDRYLAHECSAEERVHVERWMAESPSNLRRVELLADAVLAAPTRPRTELWESMERQFETPATRFPSSFRLARFPLRKLAIALVLIAGVAVAVRMALIPNSDVARPGAALRVVTTPPGQRASFRLPDGTSVMLGVASTLRYPARPGSGRRETELVGEAYFAVVHDRKRPFVVRAGDIVAEDLGTEFVIRAYREDPHARVVVREGKVAVRAAVTPTDSAGQVLLSPGQLGRLASTGTPVAEPADTAVYFAWTEGRLVFDDVPLRDALPQLSRWYDLEFRLADSSLGRVPLTATFKNQPTDEVLELLAASLGMRQVRSGRTVTFHPANSAR